MKSTYIIAEMSANHCGDFDLAKKIIQSAKDCGADAIKIQTYTADTMTIDCKSDLFKIEKGSLWEDRYLYELYQEAYTPWEWQKKLKEFADSIGIDFFSTPFDNSATDFLDSIGVKCFKIASFEAFDYSFVEYTAKKGKPLIISTGISTLEEIEEVITVCHRVGNYDITLLKCTSSYPSTLDEMNIITIKDMFDRFSSKGVKIGLSDHSMSNFPSIAAVSLGACVVEKHFTLNRDLGGADAGFSLNPQEFKSLVEDIRNTERVLGKVSYDFKESNRVGGRSLFAVKNIKKGELLSSDNIKSIRPNFGLHPKYYDQILGKKANQDILFGTPLSFDLIE